MRILVCIDKNEFFIPEFLDRILTDRPEGFEIIVAITRARPPLAKKLKAIWWKINFFRVAGLFKLALLLTKKRLCSFVKNWGEVKEVYCLRDVERKFHIEISEFRDINSSSGVKRLQHLAIDVLFSVQDLILKPDVLKAAKMGCINKHAALLPNYRGVWPVFWCLLNGEHQVGFTLHEMTERIDDGKILYQETIPIASDDTMFSLYKKVFERLPRGFYQSVRMLAADAGRYVKPGSYYSRPTRTKIREFYSKGYRIV